MSDQRTAEARLPLEAGELRRLDQLQHHQGQPHLLPVRTATPAELVLAGRIPARAEVYQVVDGQRVARLTVAR